MMTRQDIDSNGIVARPFGSTCRQESLPARAEAAGAQLTHFPCEEGKLTRSVMRPRRAAQVAAFGMLIALAAATASHVAAHAELESTVPAAGSVVHEPPARLTLRFSQRFEPAFTRVEILDAYGQQVAGHAVEVDGADPRSLGVALPKLAPGAYRVQWRVLSVDTHVSEGQFGFVVRP